MISHRHLARTNLKFLRVAFAVLICASQTAPAGERRTVQGTRISVVVPDGMDPSTRFTGFEDKESGLIGSELPGPLSKVAHGFLSGMEQQGGEQVGSEAAAFGSYAGRLYQYAFRQQGIDTIKWVAVFGNEEESFFVMATLPKARERELSEFLKRAVLSAQIDKPASVLLTAAGYEITPLGDLKIAKIVANVTWISQNGEYSSKEIKFPVMFVGAAGGAASAIDPKGFAEKKILEIPWLKDVKTRSSQSISVDGMEGFEIVADAVRKGDEAKLIFYQVVLFSPTNYYIVQGMDYASEGEARLENFKAIARTFKRRTAQP